MLSPPNLLWPQVSKVLEVFAAKANKRGNICEIAYKEKKDSLKKLYEQRWDISFFNGREGGSLRKDMERIFKESTSEMEQVSDKARDER